MNDLFRGELVRLTAEEPSVRAKAGARWFRDTEFHRFMDPAPALPESEKKIKERLEKLEEDGFTPDRYFFSVRSLADDTLIGFLNIWVDLQHCDGWVGIGIGERELWGKGYGADMMKLCLRYMFTEMNLYRVSLSLMGYNPRALRLYEKLGFRLEGRTRLDTLREGQRYDSLWMGILREEWLAMQ